MKQLELNYFYAYENDAKNNNKPPVLFNHKISPFVCTPHNNKFWKTNITILAQNKSKRALIISCARTELCSKTYIRKEKLWYGLKSIRYLKKQYSILCTKNNSTRDVLTQHQ